MDEDSTAKYTPPAYPSTPASTDADAELLQGTIIVATPTRDYRFSNQTVLIGRSMSCDIRLSEETISKRHARLRVTERAATIEDLGSANGVYVNGVRLYQPHQLRDGERIVIGSKVLTVFACDETGTRPTVPPNVSSLPPQSQSLGPDIASLATKREDALKTLGRLADKMLTMGRAVEAERVLSDHLMKVLGGSRVGLGVPEEVRNHASRYALKLAESTRRAKWANYVIELHLRANCTMSSETLAALDCALKATRGVDYTLLQTYLAALRSPMIHDPNDNADLNTVRLEALLPR